MTPEIATVPSPPNVHLTDDFLLANLPEEDGVPMESDWHVLALSLLIEIARYHHRDRHDFFAGGNMFIHYSLEQVRNRDFLGPDFFFAWGVDRDKPRRYWAVWEEGGKFPSMIVELLSPTTADSDRTKKKEIYAHTFHTPEYFLYDPDTEKLEGWRLQNGDYESIEPDERGWLWCQQLNIFLGTWDGEYQETRRTWLRFFDEKGNLLPTGREDQQRLAAENKRQADAQKRRAQEEKRRADEEKQRAELEAQRADLQAHRAELQAHRAELEAQRAKLEAQRAEQEAQRAEQEAQRADEQKRRADQAEAELARLRSRLAELEGRGK